MKTSNYQRGAAKERAAANKLLEMGCTYVYRSAGSRGIFDIIAVHDPYSIFVQVKYTKTLPKKILSILNKYSKDWKAMDGVHLSKTSLKELWVYGPYMRNPIKIGIIDVQFYQRI